MIGALCRLRSTRLCLRYSRGFQDASGRLDGSVDAKAPSRKAYEEIVQQDLREILKNEKFLIMDSNEHGFVVNKAFVRGSVLVMPDVGFFSWKVTELDQADQNTVFLISRLLPKIDILLIGAGQSVKQPPKSFVNACKKQDIGIQVESTAQAVQTYGMLLNDRRSFAAILIPASRKALSAFDQKVIEDSKKNLVKRAKAARRT